MTNCDFGSMDDLKDPVSHFVFDLMHSYGMPKALAFSFIKYGARDHARVPMQWDGGVNAGFNQGHAPWQCLNPAYTEINAEKDLNSERSVYRFYQKLLQIKKTNAAAIYGDVKEVEPENKKVVAYSREYEGKRLFVAGNFTKRTVQLELPAWVKATKLILDNYGGAEKSDLSALQPYQVKVWAEESM